MPKNDIFDRYKSIYLIQESVENGLVGGEAIDNLRNILADMYSRGEPKTVLILIIMLISFIY